MSRLSLLLICMSLCAAQEPYTFSIPFESLQYQEDQVLSQQSLPSLRDLLNASSTEK